MDIQFSHIFSKGSLMHRYFVGLPTKESTLPYLIREAWALSQPLDLATHPSPDQPEYAAQFERPDKKLLAKFFRFSLTMNTSLDKLRSKFGVVMELLKISHYIGRALRKDPIVSSTTLIRRIQKLGDYVGAAKIITKALEAPTVFGLRNAIRFIEVSLNSFHQSSQ